MSQRLHWSGFVYYYVAALIGLSFVLFGLVSVYSGLIQSALPRSSPDFEYRRDVNGAEPRNNQTPPPSPSPEQIRNQEDRAAEELRAEGFFQALQGFGATVVGVPVFVWHIRRARKREAAPAD